MGKSNFTEGLAVIGRADPTGLGSMTIDFCRAMRPQRAIVMNYSSRGPTDPRKIVAEAVYLVPPDGLHGAMPEQFLEGMKAVVGFETFYDQNVLVAAKRQRCATINFPMWECSPVWIDACDILIAVSGPEVACYPGSIRINWPVSREQFAPLKPQQPARVFAHNAGHFGMNCRNGTKWVLEASKYLAGTEAILKVRSCEPVPAGWHHSDERAQFEGMVEDRRELYAGVDCMVFPMRFPGLSLPMLEAAACFPIDTNIAAVGVKAGMTRRYSGELVRIETAAGIVEATADHPFWTDRGWCRAGDLSRGYRVLYIGDYEKQTLVHRGRIGDVVASVQNYAIARSGRADGEIIPFGALAEASAWLDETSFSDHQVEEVQAVSSRVGVYCRSYRRRGNSHHQAPVWARAGWRLGSDLRHCQHAHGANELASGAHPTTERIYSQEEQSRWTRSMLPLLCEGTYISPTVRAVASAADFEGSPDAVVDRVLQAQTFGAAGGWPSQEASRDRGGNSRPEYQAVRSIEKRSVVGLPVGNLSTDSETYLAAGYLVHNCRIPTIVLDLPEWADYPAALKVQCPTYENMGIGLRPVKFYTPDSDHMGQIMRGLATGAILPEPPPEPLTWEQFRKIWNQKVWDTL